MACAGSGAGVITRLRQKARAYDRLAALRASPRARWCWDLHRAAMAEGAADALDAMAGEIEGGMR